MEREKKSVLKRIDKIISAVLLVFVVIMSALALFFTYSRAKYGIVTMFGYSVCYVVTGSMQPTLNVGDVILIKGVENQGDIDVGDIVTYKSTQGAFAGSYITHRVVQIVINNGEYQYIMRGDDNPANDTEYINLEKVTGVYIKNIVFIQFLFGVLSNPIIFILIVVVPLLIILMMQVVNVIKSLNEKEQNENDIDLNQINEEKIKKFIEENKLKLTKLNNENNDEIKSGDDKKDDKKDD